MFIYIYPYLYIYIYNDAYIREEEGVQDVRSNATSQDGDGKKGRAKRQHPVDERHWPQRALDDQKDEHEEKLHHDANLWTRKSSKVIQTDSGAGLPLQAL